MKKYSVLAVLVAIVALAHPVEAAPLDASELTTHLDAIVELADVQGMPGMWELSFVSNMDLSGVTVGIVSKANLSGEMFLGLADNFFSFTDVLALDSFVISASPGFVPFAADAVHTIAKFNYSDGVPLFDNTGVFDTFGELLLKPDQSGIPLSRVEFRVVPEPSVVFLMGAGLAGLAFLRRWSS